MGHREETQTKRAFPLHDVLGFAAKTPELVQKGMPVSGTHGLGGLIGGLSHGHPGSGQGRFGCGLLIGSEQCRLVTDVVWSAIS